ncbi:hypothetical protein C6P45_004718 [Maudiozyma exigua]|uniref:A to I editase domain-containing protein n=1 Tax=Maudiozyma exigua TaxID=34358 RepID=A0A9P7B9P0_MAUEX|nr:hypothetical protein C6P45_004718 [Kazachstania exigua]
MDTSLKNRLTTLIYDEYRKLKPSSRPVVKSNGTKEWTVLASIVAWNTETDHLRLITLSTGVKALPDILLLKSGGNMIHDCHAEILSIRGLNTVILNHIKNIEQGRLSDLLDKDNSKYTWKSENKIILYISRMPCGDASMDTMEDQKDPASKFEINDNDPSQYLFEGNTTILRGRLNFSKKGYVRSKPGRYDSQITLSKSCSDKLCMKQVTSLLNSITYDLLNRPVYIDYLLIPSLERTDFNGIERCFKTRLNNKYQESDIHRPVFFVVETCDNQFIDDKKNDDETPSAMSSIKLYYDKSNTQEQAILNGVKNGSYTKGSKPLPKGCEPAVSRLGQWKLYKEIDQNVTGSYLEFKGKQVARREMIGIVRQMLSFDGWIHTRKDDCKS